MNKIVPNQELKSMSSIPTPQEIKEAGQAMRDIVINTPLVSMPELAEKLGLNSLNLKLESNQRTGSFKFRGAYWRCMQLSEEERKRGVVAFSSGNFAQGLAAAASLLNIPVTIVMPIDAPTTKQIRTKELGATIVTTEHGDLPRELVASEKAISISREEGKVLLHPFDDPHIIAGHASIGNEVLQELNLREHPSPTTVLSSVGGGGLLAGLALGFEYAEVIPVEPEGYDSFGQSLKLKSASTIPLEGKTICDALQAQKPGDSPFACLRQTGAGEPITVSNNEVREAMNLAFDLRRIYSEPSGAVSLAGLLKHPERFEGGDVVAIITGGNIEASDFASLLLS